jgi:Ser/Thr protein kinase RdoA (MazF antagonist)
VIQTLRGELFTRVAAADGQIPYQCDLLSWVSGEQLGRIEDPNAGELHYIERSYEQVGRLAARMHTHSEWWRPQPPFHRHSWDEDGVLGPGATWGYYGDFQVLQPTQRALLDRACAVARQRLAVFGKSPQRYGLVHADLVPENVLIDGEQCTLIDFDDSGFGWYVGDIATSVFFHLGTANFEPALQAMLRGYRQERRLEELELEVLDVLLFMRGMAVFGWVHTRSETETAHDLRAPVTSVVFALARALEGSSREFQRLRAPSLARAT